MHHNKKTNKLYLNAFTLVELIVVIVILAILSTIAFLSFASYSESAKDSKRMSNVVLMAKGFEVSISVGKYIDTADIATTPNIVLSGSSVSYAGFYSTPIKPRLLKSLGLWGGDINEIGTEDYNKYKFTYVPSIQKYQVAGILNSKDNFHSYNEFGGVDSIGGISSLDLDNNVNGVNDIFGLNEKVYAEESGSGYIFLKGNYFSTGGVEGLIPKQEVWDTTPGEVKVIPGDDIVTNGASSEPTSANCILSGSVINHGSSIDLYSESNIVWSAPYSCVDRKQSRTCNNGVLDGDDSYKYDSCVKGVVNNCSTSGSYIKNGHTYSIPALNHSSGATNILSSNVSENNGIFRYTLSNIECNDGLYINSTESATPSVVSCNSGYSQSGNSCLANSCNSTIPTNATLTTGTPTSISQARQNTNAGNDCYFSCNSGYVASGGNCTTIYTSCNATKTALPASTDGLYTIDPDGTGGNVPFQVYCDMTTYGGGRALAYRILYSTGSFPFSLVSTGSTNLSSPTDMNLNYKNGDVPNKLSHQYILLIAKGTQTLPSEYKTDAASISLTSWITNGNTATYQRGTKIVGGRDYISQDKGLFSSTASTTIHGNKGVLGCGVRATRVYGIGYGQYSGQCGGGRAPAGDWGINVVTYNSVNGGFGVNYSNVTLPASAQDYVQVYIK